MGEPCAATGSSPAAGAEHTDASITAAITGGFNILHNPKIEVNGAKICLDMNSLEFFQSILKAKAEDESKLAVQLMPNTGAQSKDLIRTFAILDSIDIPIQLLLAWSERRKWSKTELRIVLKELLKNDSISLCDTGLAIKFKSEPLKNHHRTKLKHSDINLILSAFLSFFRDKSTPDGMQANILLLPLAHKLLNLENRIVDINVKTDKLDYLFNQLDLHNEITWLEMRQAHYEKVSSRLKEAQKTYLKEISSLSKDNAEGKKRLSKFVADIEDGFAWLYITTGTKLTSAIKAAHRSIDFYLKSGRSLTHTDVIYPRYHLAESLRKRGKLVEAYREITGLLHDFDQTESLKKEHLSQYAQCKLIEGSILKAQGRYTEAIAALVQAVDFYMECDEIFFYIYAKQELASLYLRKNAIEKAKHELDEADEKIKLQHAALGISFLMLQVRQQFLLLSYYNKTDDRIKLAETNALIEQRFASAKMADIQTVFSNTEMTSADLVAIQQKVQTVISNLGIGNESAGNDSADITLSTHDQLLFYGDHGCGKMQYTRKIVHDYVRRYPNEKMLIWLFNAENLLTISESIRTLANAIGVNESETELYLYRNMFEHMKAAIEQKLTEYQHVIFVCHNVGDLALLKYLPKNAVTKHKLILVSEHVQTVAGFTAIPLTKLDAGYAASLLVEKTGLAKDVSFAAQIVRKISSSIFYLDAIAFYLNKNNFGFIQYLNLINGSMHPKADCLNLILEMTGEREHQLMMFCSLLSSTNITESILIAFLREVCAPVKSDQELSQIILNCYPVIYLERSDRSNNYYAMHPLWQEHIRNKYFVTELQKTVTHGHINDSTIFEDYPTAQQRLVHLATRAFAKHIDNREHETRDDIYILTEHLEKFVNNVSAIKNIGITSEFKNIYFTLGAHLVDFDHHLLAIPYLKQAEGIDDSEYEVDRLNYLACAEANLGFQKNALERLLRAKEAATNEHQRVQSLELLGYVYRVLGQNTEAEQAFTDCIQAKMNAEKSYSDISIWRTQAEHAATQIHLKNFDLARDKLIEILAKIESCKESSTELTTIRMTCLTYLASIYYLQNDSANAIQLCADAYALSCNHCCQSRILCCLLLVYGCALTELRKVDDALDFLKRGLSLTLIVHGNVHHRVAETYGTLVFALLMQNKNSNQILINEYLLKLYDCMNQLLNNYFTNKVIPPEFRTRMEQLKANWEQLTERDRISQFFGLTKFFRTFIYGQDHPIVAKEEYRLKQVMGIFAQQQLISPTTGITPHVAVDGAAPMVACTATM